MLYLVLELTKKGKNMSNKNDTAPIDKQLDTLELQTQAHDRTQPQALGTTNLSNNHEQQYTTPWLNRGFVFATFGLILLTYYACMIKENNLKACLNASSDSDNATSSEKCARQQWEDNVAKISFIASLLIGTLFMLVYSTNASTPCWLNTWATRRAQGKTERSSDLSEDNSTTVETQKKITLH